MAPVDPRFLAAFGTIFAASDAVALPVPDLELGQPLLDLGVREVESLPRVSVWRAADLARVEFRFVNLEIVDVDGVRYLARQHGSRPAYLVAVLCPQHLFEQAFFDPSGDTSNFVEKGKTTPDPTPGSEAPEYPVEARLSRPSRLAFAVSDQRIVYSQSGLLHAMRVLPLSVAPHAEGHSRLLDWNVVADDLGALKRVAEVSATLRTAARRHLTQLAAAPHAALPQTAGRISQALARNDATVAALTEVAGAARLRRTASELDVRFGAHSAVAAVADSITAGIDIGPVFLPDTRPPVPREPSSVETAIELPWRLQLSPPSAGAFTHSLDEVEHAGRVELWHTRLASRTDGAVDLDPQAVPPVDERATVTRTVRAVWTRDFTASQTPESGKNGFPKPEENLAVLATIPPFRSTLTAKDRMQLVHLTSNHRFPDAARRWQPSAVPVENLMLTALGGWLASEVHFPDPLPPGLTVEEWQHRATMGRDHFVKVVYQGVLLPFGNRASLIKVTERRVKADRHATLYQRLFVVLREPERRFLLSGDKTHDNRMPFRWVRILTASTPPLALPEKLADEAEGQLFMPAIATADEPDGSKPPAGRAPFRFRMIANDIDNRLIEFEGPLVFAEKSVFETARSSKFIALAAANAAMQPFPMGGQRISFAAPADPDDTTVAVESITFDAHRDTTTPDRSTNFVLPVMRVMNAPVPAMSAFTGQSGAKKLTYATAYRDHAFRATGAVNNSGGVFLELADAAGKPLTTASPMNFATQADRSGAFLNPDVEITGLARRVGPVGGDLAALASDPGSFSVGSMFAGLDSAKLFGILPLSELLPASGSPMPKFVAQAVNSVVALQQSVTQARAFALQFGGELDNQSAAVQQAAGDLAVAADTLAAAIVVFSAPPHPAQDFTVLLGDVVTHASTLLTAFDDSAPPLKLPRPVIETTEALLARITGIAGQVADIAGLIEKFYTGSLLPEQVSARLEWETPLEPWAPPGITPAVFRPEGDKTLRLTSEIQAPLSSGLAGGSAVPTAVISCSLPPFQLLLLGGTPFISIRVAVMEFSVRPGRKPDVNVQLDKSTGIEFLGPLAFVETLKEIIPFDGFSDPPYLDVQPSGLKAGFDLAIPDLAVGVFALTNIHFGAELSVPFIGESLEFRFFFATREDPFRLSVAFFAGGGFFAITISPKGVRMIEASFEFGAAVEMSFVVASGSLSVMAGIYFRLEIEGEKQSVQLTGFFRARGEVDVLGLISACIELYLELSYRSIDGPGPGESSAKAVGKASISIEVSVCFLSFSVSVSCEKQFAGSSGDPTFVDTMGEYTDALGAARDPWAEYWGAFAAVGA